MLEVVLDKPDFAYIVVYAFTVWGLSNILAFMKISDGIRSLHPLIQEVLGCPACNAFWIGFIFYFLDFSPIPNLNPIENVLLNDLILAFLSGNLASGISWTVYCLLHLTGQYD